MSNDDLVSEILERNHVMTRLEVWIHSRLVIPNISCRYETRAMQRASSRPRSSSLLSPSPHFITFGTLWLCWDRKETWVPLTLTSSLKLQSTQKSWWLVQPLCSHSRSYLLSPVLQWLQDQHLHKGISSKNMFPIVLMFSVNLKIWQSRWKWFSTVCESCLLDNSELCWLVSEYRVWPAA